MSYYRQQLESWLSELDVKAGRVLDIGGQQGVVEGRTKSWEVHDYQILDLPDFDLEDEWDYEHSELLGVADVIFCLEVFEYLVDPLQALENIYFSLKRGGTAYITFAFVYPHHNELELDALRYTEPGIMRLAWRARLNVESITYRHDRSGNLERFYRADGMHPAKDYPDHNVTGFIVEMKK